MKNLRVKIKQVSIHGRGDHVKEVIKHIPGKARVEVEERTPLEAKAAADLATQMLKRKKNGGK